MTCRGAVWRRALGVAVLATAARATPGAAQAPAVPQAWRFTWTTSTTAAGQPVPNSAMVFDVAIWRGAARIAVRSGPLRAITGDSGAILLRDADSVLTIVNPTRRDALVATLGEVSAMMSGTGALQLVVADVSSAMRSGGAGAPLDRYSTRRVQLDQRYTMRISAQQLRRALRVEEETTLDLSAAVASLDPGFRAFADQFLRALGKPAAVRAALRSREAELPKGMPLWSRIVSITVSGSDTLRTETVGVMSALRRGSVDTSTFAAPADYRRTEVRRLLQPRGAP